ncbi:MAG: molybdopterin-dependent oxidoreductase, partial [Acidobacteriota bacterium]
RASSRRRASVYGQGYQLWLRCPGMPFLSSTVGAYGHALPMQHGAPWRLMLPWKYGYKSAKSIVAMEFTEQRPGTFWNDLQPREYGFYSNVEPEKPHPRWSQRWEEDIGTGKTRETLPYNGYADAVGSLYTGKEI